MERKEYVLIKKIIGQTINFLNRTRSLNLHNEEIDEIKNMVLLKLTPHLKRILKFEELHLKNFIRKTTRSVVWDHLKSKSPDLTNYRTKKRIKVILQNLKGLKTQFKNPDNHASWYKNPKELDTQITDSEKRTKLENIVRDWEMNSPYKSYTSDERLTDLITGIFSKIDFGISVNDIFSSMSSIVDTEEIIQIPFDVTDPDDTERYNLASVIGEDKCLPLDFKTNDFFYENYVEEFLENHVSREQAWVYYLRSGRGLNYKDIEETYHINVKTAESRMSIKADKRGFQWRLVQFIKELELNVEEVKKFFDVLNRKIKELYSRDI